MADLREKRIELLLQQLQQLPTLPAVALRVLEVTARDESSAREVVELIESDQALTAKILQLVHSAANATASEVNTVERAVVLLGFEAVRSAVLAVSVYQLLDSQGERSPRRFDREAFWRHCVAVASCCELLATAFSDPRAVGLDPSEAFVCGLLHDAGKIALDAVLPKSYDRIIEAADLLRGNIADVERAVIGIDHMIVGKRLGEQWRLPDSIRDCMWLHGQRPDALPASVKNPRLVNLVTLADAIVRDQHLGYSGNYAQPGFKADLLRVIGLTEEQIASAQRQLIERIEQRARILGLGRSTSGELYLSALAQANQELGRLGEQLAAKNRRLAVRAKFFEALAQFQGELRPDAPPTLVLQAIGQTALPVLALSPVAVFSAQPGHGYGEVAVLDEHGDVSATAVVDSPPRIEKPAGGDGPVLPAGPDMEWLLATVSPHLADSQRFWICLEAEGACIGGIVWGAKPGESQRLAPQAQELLALSAGWSLALRMAQIREQSRVLAEELAEANRRLESAQAELIRRRTLASVGEMAAGAAHEMNNPLAVISGRSQLLANQIGDAKLKAAASTVADQAHRLSQIITDLMEFARPVPPEPRETDLAELLDRALYDVRSQGEAGNRKFELTMGETPPVVVDPQQVQAAFAQILHNAVQATDEREGRIMIHAAYDAFSARVVVSVTDNGRGMDPATLRRAFDPFFSSLPAGRRRGLGLAKALRWVESSGGSIRLESHPQQGTRATVLLPAAWPVASERNARARQAADG